MIDFSKPVETVNGLPARVVDTNYKGALGSVVVIVTFPEGRELILISKPDGTFIGCNGIYNLRNKREVAFKNVYATSITKSKAYTSLQTARTVMAGPSSKLVGTVEYYADNGEFIKFHLKPE